MYHTGLGLHLRRHGLEPSEADPGLYGHHSPVGTTLTGVTIDDFLVLAPTTAELEAFTQILDKKYNFKDLSPPRLYLRWSIR